MYHINGRKPSHMYAEEVHEMVTAAYICTKSKNKYLSIGGDTKAQWFCPHNRMLKKTLELKLCTLTCINHKSLEQMSKFQDTYHVILHAQSSSVFCTLQHRLMEGRELYLECKMRINSRHLPL